MDSLNVSARCGCSPKSRQIRPIVERLNPVRDAIDARDQCVALRGVCSNVATITCSTCSTEIDGGRPGRSSSTSPSSRRAANRVRHLVTIDVLTCNFSATSLLDRPSAQANTTRDRRANA